MTTAGTRSAAYAFNNCTAQNSAHLRTYDRAQRTRSPTGQRSQCGRERHARAAAGSLECHIDSVRDLLICVPLNDFCRPRLHSETFTNARKPRPAVPALAVTGKTRDSPDLQTTNETHRGSPALQENAQTRAYRSALALRSARIKMSVRGVSEFHRAIFLLGSPIRLRFGVLIFCLKLRWASPRNFSQKRPPVPTSRSSHSPRACIPRLRQAKCKAQQILRCRLLLLFDLTVIHL